MSEIKIVIEEDSVSYETELDPAELVFWLEAVKSMIIRTVMESAKQD